MSLRAIRDRKKVYFFWGYETWEGALLFSCKMLFIEKKGSPLIIDIIKDFWYATWERCCFFFGKIGTRLGKNVASF